MSDPFNIFINRTWLPDLGRLMGPLAPLSPFGLGTPRGDLRGEFTQAGLVDVEGKISPRYMPAFTCLAQPTRLVRLRYFAPDREIEYQAYFAANGDIASMVSTEDGFKIAWPGVPGVALNIIGEIAGISTEPQLTPDLNLPGLEARVALALVDATRQAFLMRITAEGEPAIVSVTPESLAVRLAPDAAHLNRLETIYRELEVPDPPVDAAGVRAALGSLVGQGLAQEKEGGFIAAGALLALAGNLLLVSGWFQFDSVEGTDPNQINAGRGIVVQGGPRALLLLEHDAGNIRITGLSGAAFIQIVGELFGFDPGKEPVVASAEADALAAELAALPPEDGPDVSPPSPVAPAAPDPDPIAVPDPEPIVEPATEPIVEPDTEPVVQTEPAPAVVVPPEPVSPPAPQVTIPKPPSPSSAGPKFCGKCGAPRQSDAPFCGKCGSPMA